MRCLWLIASFFYWSSAALEVDNRVLQIFQNVQEDEAVSNECRTVLELYIENLQAETDQWALSMLDATSKIPVGILSLNFGELGQFSQCLSTESENGNIQPKYCLATLKVPAANNTQYKVLQRKTHLRETSRLLSTQQTRDANNTDNSMSDLGFSWALCLPRNCSDEDATIIFNIITETTRIYCQTRDDVNPSLNPGAIAAIVVLSFLAFPLVASTVLDLYYRHKEKDPPLGFVAFSMYTNVKKLFRINNNAAELACLNGIKFFSICWVLIGHVYEVTCSLPMTNVMDALEWLDSWTSMFIVSGTHAVDSFLFLSGLLVVYGFLKAKYHGVKFNIFYFYIHRYLRLIPAIAPLILVTATLLRYMGSGPKWNDISPLESDCQKYWWSTLLFVQNYANPTGHICLGHTWYLSVDMQLYILSPLVLIPLWRYPKIGVGLVITAIVTFMIVPFTIAYITEIPAFITNMNPRVPILDFTVKYYIKTHTRAAPWFIGALLGYILAKIKFENGTKKLRLNKVVVVLIWLVCFAIILACTFGGHSTLRGYDYDRLENSFYLGFVKPAWAFCLSWIVLACVSGYGGPINWFLSFPVYQVLNRFTYSVYLLHYPILQTLGFRNKIGVYFDHLSMAYSFWGLVMFSYALALIWVLTFESPIVILEKIMFSGSKKRTKLEERGNQNDSSSQKII